MIRKALAGAVAGAALVAPLALAAPAQATQGGPTILDVVNSVDRFTSTEVAPIKGLDLPKVDRFRWDQRNWYDFDILTAAVVANGTLVGAVTDPGTSATLFAPNDRAFQLLARDLTGKWYATESGVLKAIVGAVGTGDVLTKVLTYHVVGGKFEKADVVPLIGQEIPTLAGEPIVVQKPNKLGLIRIKDVNRDFRDPFLVRTDIDAGHSVIHSISRVLMPTLPAS
ncbi:MAG: fasciclin domain-containing protein [Candidatus Nanopelagicales bacterium]|nr:fasciclin domain-containing protein [Candidatus Nanopelagicales bacterium]